MGDNEPNKKSLPGTDQQPDAAQNLLDKAHQQYVINLSQLEAQAAGEG